MRWSVGRDQSPDVCIRSRPPVVLCVETRQHRVVGRSDNPRSPAPADRSIAGQAGVVEGCGQDALLRFDDTNTGAQGLGAGCPSKPLGGGVRIIRRRVDERVRFLSSSLPHPGYELFEGAPRGPSSTESARQRKPSHCSGSL